MRSFAFMTLLIAAIVQSIGCCGPMGCGVGCGRLGDHCYDCEGGFGPRYAATGPIDALRQARRSMVCGGGCGEVYYGEWTSTPPYAQDPCCGSEFVGGGTRCEPFCWQPGTLLAGLYGQRFYEGCDDCCQSCGGECDGDCGNFETSDMAPVDSTVGRHAMSSGMMASQTRGNQVPQIDPYTRNSTVKTNPRQSGYPVSTGKSSSSSGMISNSPPPSPSARMSGGQPPRSMNQRR
jgi:hypothetical protein